VDHEFWQARWQTGQIGFHEGAPNAYLVAHHGWLTPCKRILVPLCGKTHDLAFLAGHGHEVVGIELVEDAVRQFFAEHEVTPVVEPAGSLARYSAGAITVLAGDVFATTPELVGRIDGIFDRAALVALPPDLRTQYVAHLRTLAPTATRELLVSIEYPEGAHGGPPFSVLEPEVRERFASARSIEDVASGPDPQGRLDGKMVERCYQIALG
jgi:thiopurine S-methyltransferase